MKMNEQLQKILSKVYEPSTMVDMKLKGNDVSFKTDEKGTPVLLFIGERKENGSKWHGERRFKWDITIGVGFL